MNLSASEGVGIMARLAQQPPVMTGADVLKSMSSFQCDTTWNRVFQNMATTNSLGLKGPGGFQLFGAKSAGIYAANRMVGTSVASELGVPSLPRVLFGGGLRGLAIEGVNVSGGEALLVAVGGAGAEFGLSYPAWNAGVFVGSMVNVMMTAPCRYGQ